MQPIDPRILQDFRVFLYVLWKHLGLPEPTPIQYDIAYYLQHGPERIVIEAFRGVGKSWVTSAFVCWLLLRNPDTKILVVSASKERADAFSTFVKRLITEVPELQHLQAKQGQRDSMLAFDVGPARPDHAPSVKSVGITGQMAGSRADVIIADDVEVPKNSATQIQRDQLSEAVKEFDAILKPLPTSRIIYLGTPQTEMSLYNLLPERGYVMRVWPAQYPALNKIANYKGALAPIIGKAMTKEGGNKQPGTTTDPQRFSDEDLAKRRLSYGASGFALQFMLDTTLSDATKYPLKVSDLIVMSVNPEMAPVKVAWAADPDNVINDISNLALTGDRYYAPMFWSKDQLEPYRGGVMAIDPSGRGKDQTGWAVVNQLAGLLWCPDFGGLQGGYEDDTLIALAKKAAQYRVSHIIIESNFGDGMFTRLFQPVLFKYHKCLVEEVRHSQQKELRIIDVLEPILNSHKLVMDRRALQRDYEETQADLKYSLVYQMTRLTKERGALLHDDRLDALAMAVAYWVEAMAQDNDKAAKSYADARVEEALKAFMKRAQGFGGRGKQDGPDGWLHGCKTFH